MSRIAPSHLAGLVLAGGRSSRFGAEKAVQTLAGVTLLERALAVLDGACAAVAVSAAPGGARDLAERLGLTVLADDPAHAVGPLAGVAAGLAWARAKGFSRLLSLPCDTPLIGATELRRLVDAGEAGAYAVTADGPQALIALWPTTAAERLAARLAAGEHPPVRGFLLEIGAVPVVFEDAAPFRNANTPAELAEIAQRLGSSSSSASQTEADSDSSATS